ncbi:FecR domain-containing protein [Spirosoma sp. BT702]|uniref:FecR domain-containing protein n=1 Tax=Spirosoma profusum TaxID=2771354 RepID=A0A926Y304_9BACT|nr:FecR domain-containing protein [Spirosoma profusum]MBD2702963.1 FecR domain-containing protein [Spirosoma profusum]
MEVVNKELIFNHFSRKTSPIQRELIANWLREESNEERYYAWLEEWENKQPQYLTKSEEALRRYSMFLVENPHENVANTTGHVSELPLSNRWTRTQWLLAASILLLLGISTFLFRNELLYQTYQTAYGETRSIRLSDGSSVLINANSRLEVPRWGFGRQTREVTLAGEATFSVTHLPDAQRFIVKTANNFNVVVLGTEFSVFARKRGARVALNKGKVQLQYREGLMAKQVIMKPGDLFTLDLHNHLAIKTISQHKKQISWQEKRFVFDETTLQEVAYMLEDNYGLQVSIKNRELAERVLMGSFRADNVDQLLQSISELLDITVVRQENKVQIMDQ